MHLLSDAIHNFFEILLKEFFSAVFACFRQQLHNSNKNKRKMQSITFEKTCNENVQEPAFSLKLKL